VHRTCPRDHHLPATARDELAAAFIGVGGEPRQAETVAAELLAAASRFGGHVHWVDHAGLVSAWATTAHAGSAERTATSPR